MKDYVKEIKMVENGLVIILLFVIIIILLPSFTTMADKSMELAAQTNAINNIEMVKELYTIINLNDEVNLPFKVVYNSNGYKIYSKGKEYTKPYNINIEGTDKLPTEGSIEIKANGKAIVDNLKFGNYTCNQINTEKPVCKR